MMPSWPSRSPGLTCDTTSGMSTSMRHADELSITVAPAGRGGASLRGHVARRRRTARCRRPRTLRASPRRSRRLPVDRDGASCGATGGEQAEVRERKLAFVEDLDHRPPDDAGGADDGDGEGSAVHEGDGSAQWLKGCGHARKYSSAQPPFRRRLGGAGTEKGSPSGDEEPLWRGGVRAQPRLRPVPWPGGAASRPCARG